MSEQRLGSGLDRRTTGQFPLRVKSRHSCIPRHVRFKPKADIGEAARYVRSGPDFRLEISGAADLN